MVSKLGFILLGISLLDLMGCGHLGVDRVWELRASQSALVRTSSQPLDYAHANLFRCISPHDYNAWLYAWSGCKPGSTPPSLSVVIYILNPHLGLVRSQVSAVIPFPSADGFKCLSPDDFTTALNEYRKCYDR